MPQDYAKSVLPILIQTRSMLMPMFGKATELARKSVDVASAVTAIDHAVENFLCDELKKTHPLITFAGEEFGGDRNAERFWLCDPIDGTFEFIRGLLGSTVMLALIETGQVTFGAIYDFVNDVVYHAQKGQGSFANGEKIIVSNRSIRDAYVLLETRLAERENLELFWRVNALAGAGVHTAETSGLELVRVACGKFDGRISFNGAGQDYDRAPGSIIVREAGGVVANIGTKDTEPFDYRISNYIAATPAVFRALTTGEKKFFPI